MWDGKMVHRDEFETRQPQDFTKPTRASRPLNKVRTPYIPT